MSVVAEALEVRIDADPCALRRVRGSLRAWLTSVGAGQVDDVVLAVGEAVANALEHGGAGAVPPGPPITVSARVDHDAVHIEVHDPGRWRTPVPGGERGRGIGIMRSVMDHVDVRTGAHGTSVVMRRRLQ